MIQSCTITVVVDKQPMALGDVVIFSRMTQQHKDVALCLEGVSCPPQCRRRWSQRIGYFHPLFNVLQCVFEFFVNRY